MKMGCLRLKTVFPLNRADLHSTYKVTGHLTSWAWGKPQSGGRSLGPPSTDRMVSTRLNNHSRKHCSLSPWLPVGPPSLHSPQRELGAQEGPTTSLKSHNQSVGCPKPWRRKLLLFKKTHQKTKNHHKI